MILISLKLKMNSATKPKPIPNPIPHPTGSNECETKEYIGGFLIICWIAFLIWGFIYLLTRDVEETDDDSSQHGGGLHGRLRM